MSEAKFQRHDPRYDLPFFRRATKSEIDTGTFGYVAWSVHATGHHSTDFARGTAIAEEAIAFMVNHPTYGNMTMISDMLRDIHRQADPTHRSMISGFGLRIGQFAAVGAALVGIDAVREAEIGDKIALMARAAPTPDPMLDLVTQWNELIAAAEALPNGEVEVFWKDRIEPIERQVARGPVPETTTMPGAIAAIHKALSFDDMEDQDANLIRSALAYLEGEVVE